MREVRQNSNYRLATNSRSARFFLVGLLACMFSLFVGRAFAAEGWTGAANNNDALNSAAQAVNGDETSQSQSPEAGDAFVQNQVAEHSAKLNNNSASRLDQLQTLQNALPNANHDNAASGKDNNAQNTANVSVKGMSEGAFSSMVGQALPMSSEQIVRLHQLYNETQRAASTTPGVPPKPVSRTLMVQLSPGATPPVVRLSAGFISSLVFVDSSGAPWPIVAYDLGNPKAYNISWNRKDNMLMVQALTLATVANIMVKLANLDTPVMLTLVPDQQAVDYRVDLHIPGTGPNANPLQASGLPETSSPSLLDILNGVTPVGAKVLTVVSGEDCQAWLMGKMLYLRSRYHVISPGWYSTMSSADGTNAYMLPRTTTVLLSGHGKTMTLKLAGF